MVSRQRPLAALCALALTLVHWDARWAQAQEAEASATEEQTTFNGPYRGRGGIGELDLAWDWLLGPGYEGFIVVRGRAPELEGGYEFDYGVSVMGILGYHTGNEVDDGSISLGQRYPFARFQLELGMSIACAPHVSVQASLVTGAGLTWNADSYYAAPHRAALVIGVSVHQSADRP